MYNCKIYDTVTGEPIVLEKPEDVIGKKVNIRGTEYTVVGIIDSGELPSKYDELKDPENRNYTLYSGLYYELQDGLHLMAFVDENSFVQIAEENHYSYVMEDFDSHRVSAAMGKEAGNTYIFPEWANAGYAAFSKYAVAEDIFSLVDGKTVPADNEAVISKGLFYELLMELANKDMSSSDAAVQEKAGEIYELASKLYLGGVEYENKLTGAYEFRAFTEAETQEYFDKLISLVKEDSKQLTLAMKLFDDSEAVTIGAEQEYTIIGLWDGGTLGGQKILLSDKAAKDLWETHKVNLDYYSEYITDYVEPEGAIYETLFLPYDHSDEQTNQLWDIYENKKYDENDSRSTLTSALISNLEMVDMMVDALSKVFLYVGLVLAVFAALLLSNFISVSISYKKREIGILRAVGARSIDVFKIFFSESFVITAICIVLSVLGSLACCALINGVLVELISASLFVFGPLSFGVLLAVATITAVVATFLPVWNAAKKKPVESIRAL